MITSTAASIQLISDIPDSDIKLANQLNNNLSKITKLIAVANQHLNGLYEPFKAVPQIPTNETIKNRVYLRAFRNQVIKNFNNVLRIAYNKNFKKTLKHFSIDTEINELILSFEKSLEDVVKQVNLFLKLFSNLSAVDFKDRVITGIDNIKKQCAQLIQLIDDRFILHIEENIINQDEDYEDDELQAVANFNKEKEFLINKLASFNFKV